MAVRRQQIAVIGSGAGAYGVLARLAHERRDADIVLFDYPDKGISEPAEATTRHEAWSSRYFAALHRSVRKEVGLSFPPVKQHFGRPVEKYRTDLKQSFWRSAEPGGLTTYWSSSMFPYRRDVFAEWGHSMERFLPHYRFVADQIAIAGKDDGLSHHFDPAFIGSAPPPATQFMQQLEAAISGKGGALGLAAGQNRVAIDTNARSASACSACGGCFYGCYRGSIFHAVGAIRKN